MLSQQMVERGRHLGGKRGGTSDPQVDVGADCLQRGRKLARLVVGHEVQKMEPPIGPADGPRANRHVLPDADLVEVADVPFQRERAGLVGLEILVRQPDAD